MNTEKSFAAFAGPACIGQGDLAQMAQIIKPLVDAKDPRTLLVFAYPTGEQVDLDLRGTLDDVLGSARRQDQPVRRTPGRPKLGVVGREITLLPRHWEWLNAQPGGASVALRKLVEQARKGNLGSDRVRRSKEAAFRFMTAIAGNEPGFEEASRALFAADRTAFELHTREWPKDIRDFSHRLAGPAFAEK